jgi:hypothetical protein
MISATKVNEIMSFTGKWTELETNVKWNKPHTEGQVSHVFSHMWKLK